MAGAPQTASSGGHVSNQPGLSGVQREQQPVMAARQLRPAHTQLQTLLSCSLHAPPPPNGKKKKKKKKRKRKKKLPANMARRAALAGPAPRQPLMADQAVAWACGSRLLTPGAARRVPPPPPPPPQVEEVKKEKSRLGTWTVQIKSAGFFLFFSSSSSSSSFASSSSSKLDLAHR